MYNKNIHIFDKITSQLMAMDYLYDNLDLNIYEF